MSGTWFPKNAINFRCLLGNPSNSTNKSPNLASLGVVPVANSLVDSCTQPRRRARREARQAWTGTGSNQAQLPSPPETAIFYWFLLDLKDSHFISFRDLQAGQKKHAQRWQVKSDVKAIIKWCKVKELENKKGKLLCTQLWSAELQSEMQTIYHLRYHP